MTLPNVPIVGCPNSAAGLVRCFHTHHIDTRTVRRWTQGDDDLRSPLTSTREADFTADPAAAIIRLFFCRERFEVNHAAELIGSSLLETLLEINVLIRPDIGRVIAPFHLRLARGLYLFSDYLEGHPDAVMGAGETTAILYQAARRPQRLGAVLDLGCGAGTLALLLARDAEAAIGTDINPRAVAFAQFNAQVNSIENAEFRTGDLYAPVADQTFDLIVSQPPYYPIGVGGGDGKALAFLHGGPRGDELANRVVAELPAHLNTGGRGIVFTSWPEVRQPSIVPSIRTLELTTNRRELHGARQSINVIEHSDPGREFAAAREVPADSWGDVHSWRLDQMLEVEDLLRHSDDALLPVRLRMPEGARRFDEGLHMFLRCPPESLAGFAPIDRETWEVLSKVNDAPTAGEAGLPETALAIVRRSLERGLLMISPCPT